MRAESVTKINNLLNIGIPKKVREDRAHYDKVEYITPDHVACVTAICGCAGNDRQFIGEREEPINIAHVIRACGDKHKSEYNRKMLLEILSNLDSEYVTIYMDDDHPMMIEGTIEDLVQVQGCIAPIIRPPEEDE